MKQADARKPTLTFPSKAYADNGLAHMQFTFKYKSRVNACTKEIKIQINLLTAFTPDATSGAETAATGQLKTYLCNY